MASAAYVESGTLNNSLCWEHMHPIYMSETFYYRLAPLISMMMPPVTWTLGVMLAFNAEIWVWLTGGMNLR